MDSNGDSKVSIEEHITGIEKKYGVCVVFACESGSRAWGFPSPDSDYDVRCIYVHPPEWYLSIGSLPDTIEAGVSHDEIDLAGWELRKSLGLARNQTPSFGNGCNPQLYIGKRADFVSPCLELSSHVFLASQRLTITSRRRSGASPKSNRHLNQGLRIISMSSVHFSRQYTSKKSGLLRR